MLKNQLIYTSGHSLHPVIFCLALHIKVFICLKCLQVFHAYFVNLSPLSEKEYDKSDCLILFCIFCSAKRMETALKFD